MTHGRCTFRTIIWIWWHLWVSSSIGWTIDVSFLRLGHATMVGVEIRILRYNSLLQSQFSFILSCRKSIFALGRQILRTLSVIRTFRGSAFSPIWLDLDNMDAIVCAPELNLTMMKGNLRIASGTFTHLPINLIRQAIWPIVVFLRKPTANLPIFWSAKVIK